MDVDIATLGIFEQGSEGKSEACHQRAAAGQLCRKIQGVQSVILVRYIEQPDRQLRLTAPEPVTGKHVKLPKVIAGLIRGVASVALTKPQ